MKRLTPDASCDSEYAVIFTISQETTPEQKILPSPVWVKEPLMPNEGVCFEKFDDVRTGNQEQDPTGATVSQYRERLTVCTVFPPCRI